MVNELEQLRDLALRIALDVGQLPLAAQPASHAARTMAVATKSNDYDLVTELDAATETAITAALAAERPQDGILAEEGARGVSSSGFTWVIDPIDGTVNYFYGHPHWCVCLGVTDAAGEPVVGVVHAPALGETFVAARGLGASVCVRGEWQPLAEVPDAVADLGGALLATGFSYDPERRRDMARVFADFVPRVRDMRRSGSAGLDLVFVAAGRLHGFYERDLKPWDRVAATVVCREAGIDVRFRGEALGPNLTVAAAPRLADVLEAELARLGVTG